MSLQSEINFLTVEQVLDIHKSLIKMSGGKEGLRDEKLFNSALFQPQQTFDGVYLYDSIYKMAAAYLFSFAKDHCFIDGNKRIAIACCMIFLEINGYRVLLSSKEAVDITLKCVVNSYSLEDIADILEKNTALCTKAIS